MADRPPRPTLIAFVGAGALPFVYLHRTGRHRGALFDEQLADALDVVSRALRAGNPFSEALKLVAQEMDDPIATEFGLAFADINYGLSVNAALTGMIERTPNVSLAVAMTAVMIQRETGGNLAEVLEKVAEVVRARHRFRRRLRTLTAEGRISAWVLIATPIALAGGLMLASPDYLPMMLEDPMGPKLLAIAAGLMVAGMLWIRRIMRLEM